MKAIILAGGLGTRISEETSLRPKPMVEIGRKPILWHIMKTYSAHGIHDFVIRCGYKGYVIKEYFANYFLHMSDVMFDMEHNKMEVYQRYAEPWNSFMTPPDYIVRDFMHPSDFFQLISMLLSAPVANAAVDCYNRAPIDKPGLLAAMQEKFGLQYETTEAIAAGVNATDSKPHYYSLNTRAADFGYQPAWTSLEGILIESREMLQCMGEGAGA